jgi:signal transduction histidine kinase
MNSRIKRSCLLFLVLFGCASGVIANSAQSGAIPRELLVGIYDNPPQVFWDENNRPAGIYMDFLRDVAEREFWKLRFKAGTFSELSHLLEQGEIDLLPSMALSYERLQRFDFGRVPVMENWGVLHRRKDVVIHNVFDLEGKTVYGMEGCIHMQAFMEMIDRYKVVCEVVGVSSYHVAMQALEQGGADAAVVNRTFSTREGGKYQTVASSFIFNPIPLHFAVSRHHNRDVVHILDRELAAQKRDPNSVLQKAMNHWLRPDLEGRIPAWIRLAAAVLIVGLIGLFLLNRTLSLMVRRRTAELEREKENTVKALRAQNLFLATMSHELRTPLNFVRGSMDLLRDELPENTDANEVFGIFERGVDRLERLLTSLLRFADVERDDFDVNLESVDLHALLEEIHATARILRRAEGVVLNFECELEPEQKVQTDSGAIFQIALNLLHNATKFTDEGQITLRAYLETANPDHFLKLEVIDTGLGIPVADLESILIPFKKGTETNFVEEGSGLGLSIVDCLVKALGGEMTLQSEIGKGSTFTVTIPIALTR